MRIRSEASVVPDRDAAAKRSDAARSPAQRARIALLRSTTLPCGDAGSKTGNSSIRSRSESASPQRARCCPPTWVIRFASPGRYVASDASAKPSGIRAKTPAGSSPWSSNPFRTNCSSVVIASPPCRSAVASRLRRRYRERMRDDSDSVGELLADVAREAQAFDEALPDLRVSARGTAQEIRGRLASYDFAVPRPATEVLEDVATMLRRWNVHVTHPRYFGLFNPSVVPAAVAAEALAAAVNPQMAVWSHAPAANEIERHVLRTLASLIGFDPDTTGAHFTTGGQESNLT